MKKINKNLIALFVVSAFILMFSFTSPVSANFLTSGSGAIANPLPNNIIVYPTPVYPTPVYPTPSNPFPVIYSINPNSAALGSGSITVAITGANFVSSSSAEWNGSSIPTNYVDSNDLTATVDSSKLTTPGNYSITVFNPAPGGGTSNGKYFTVQTYQAHNGTFVGGLSANAFSAGFMPSNLLEWLLLFLIILLIVIIVRKLMKKNKEPSLTVSNVSATSVTLSATGLTPNVTHVFEIAGPLGANSNKVQVTAGNDGTANVSFANLNPDSHYTASVKKYNPTNGLLSNVGIPDLHFDTLKQA
jgi:uncharacterized protein (UPF0333 family)